MPPSSRARSSVTRTVATQNTLTVAAGSSGNHVYAAAMKIAEGIKERSGAIPSEKIPPSVHVGQGSPTTATVYADAPNARPIELGLRHPLFGDREHWYPMKQIRFMEEGAALRLDDAAAEYGKTVDDWLRAYE